jgi:hypothetical protein
MGSQSPEKTQGEPSFVPSSGELIESDIKIGQLSIPIRNIPGIRKQISLLLDEMEEHEIDQG